MTSEDRPNMSNGIPSDGIPPPAPPVRTGPDITTTTTITPGDAPINPSQGYQYGMNPEIDRLRVQVELNKSVVDNKIVDNQIAMSQENWVKAYWRPAMGWLYGFICIMDFVGFPLIAIFMPLIQNAMGIPITPYVPWKSITLENGGLFHLSFGAILGVAAWTRGSAQKAMLEK